jgi:hypothetical protein
VPLELLIEGGLPGFRVGLFRRSPESTDSGPGKYVAKTTNREVQVRPNVSGDAAAVEKLKGFFHATESVDAFVL